jgi:hypothetical protein
VFLLAFYTCGDFSNEEDNDGGALVCLELLDDSHHSDYSGPHSRMTDAFWAKQIYCCFSVKNSWCSYFVKKNHHCFS